MLLFGILRREFKRFELKHLKNYSSASDLLVVSSVQNIPDCFSPPFAENYLKISP